MSGFILISFSSNPQEPLQEKTQSLLCKTFQMFLIRVTQSRIGHFCIQISCLYEFRNLNFASSKDCNWKVPHKQLNWSPDGFTNSQPRIQKQLLLLLLLAEVGFFVHIFFKRVNMTKIWSLGSWIRQTMWRVNGSCLDIPIDAASAHGPYNKTFWHST